MKAKKNLFIVGMLVCVFMYMFIMANVCSAVAVFDFEQTVEQSSGFNFNISEDGTIAGWTFQGYLNGPADIEEAWLDIEMKIKPVQIMPGVSIYAAVGTITGDSIFIDTIWEGNGTGDVINISYSKDLGASLVYENKIKIFEAIEGDSFTVNLLIANNGGTSLGEITEITSSTLKGNFVPIPGSLILLGSALAGFMVIRRRGTEVV